MFDLSRLELNEEALPEEEHEVDFVKLKFEEFKELVTEVTSMSDEIRQYFKKLAKLSDFFEDNGLDEEAFLLDGEQIGQGDGYGAHYSFDCWLPSSMAC